VTPAQLGAPRRAVVVVPPAPRSLSGRAARVVVVVVVAAVPLAPIVGFAAAGHRHAPVSVPDRLVEWRCIDHTITQDVTTSIPGQLLAVGTQVTC
jgi:hypothetical protein